MEKQGEEEEKEEAREREKCLGLGGALLCLLEFLIQCLLLLIVLRLTLRHLDIAFELRLHEL